MKIHSWGATDIGRKRKVNEDTYLIVPELGLIAVADGMGGHERGDVAAQLACNVVKENLGTHRGVLDMYRRNPSDATRSALRAMLESTMQKACDEVYQAAQSITDGGSVMGTTLDVLLVAGTTVFICHVGDGRILLVRGAEAHQLTEDHTLVQQQLREGTITPEAAANAKHKNVITRALGAFPSVLVDHLHFEVDMGDRLIVCSDGLHKYLGLEELGLEMMRGVNADTVEAMVSTANERGGSDNITCVVATTEPEWTGEFVAPTRERMDVLRRSRLFQYCTYRELMAVCQMSERRVVPGSTRLFKELDQGSECFVIVSGEVVINKSGIQLAKLGPADHFGEMSFIDQPLRSADAVTVSDTELLVLRRDRFIQLMKQDGDLASKIMWQLLQKLSSLLRSTNQRLVDEKLSINAMTDLEIEISSN